VAEPALESRDLRSLARGFCLGGMTDHVTCRMPAQPIRRSEPPGPFGRLMQALFGIEV